MPYLITLQGPDAGRKIELAGDRLTIGRSPRCDVVFHDPEVSRRHVELNRTSGTWRLSDMESSNGTVVNGRPVNTAELRDRDRLQIGRNVLLFATGPVPELHSTSSLAGPRDAGEDPFGIEIVAEPKGSADDRSNFRYVFAPRPGDGEERRGGHERRDSREDLMARRRRPADEAVPPEGAEYWQMMYRAVMQLSHTADPSQLVDEILEMVFQWVACDRGCVLLSDPNSKQLRPAGRKDRVGRPGPSSMQISRSILDYVLRTGEGILSGDATSDDRWGATASISQAGVREAICVPMTGRYGVVGVIYIDTAASAGEAARRDGELFNREHLKLLAAIGQVAALIVEDAYNYRAMLQSERLAAMGVVIATISHHIKNILQGIEGGSFIVADALRRDDLAAIKSGWKIVEKNQARIKSLVLDMLAYAKEREPRLARLDANQVVADVVELIAAAADELGVALSLERCPQPAYIYGESDALYHAVLNLANNALDACVERRRQSGGDYKPRVCLSVHRRRSVVETVVADNALGLSDSQIGRLFVAFESTKGARGSGLGLAVSKKIVEEHGGRIAVDSRPLEGTRFVVQLPIDAEGDHERRPGEATITLEADPP